MLNKDQQKSNLPYQTPGFTIIELLVVIALIGLLTVVVVVILSSVKPKSRNARRHNDLNQVVYAIAQYSDAHEDRYPTAYKVADSNTNHTRDLGEILWDDNFSKLCEDKGAIVPNYLDRCPSDPTKSGNEDYGYQSYNDLNLSQATSGTETSLSYALVATKEDEGDGDTKPIVISQ